MRYRLPQAVKAHIREALQPLPRFPSAIGAGKLWLSGDGPPWSSWGLPQTSS